MERIKEGLRKKKLKALLNWINDVYHVGMHNVQIYTLNTTYNNEINSTRHMTRENYKDLKTKLLSLAVAVEYGEDTSNERKMKIYTCYKNGGNTRNDLIDFIDYIIEFYAHNSLVNEIQEIRQQIIEKNKTTFNYKEYFELKYNILHFASYGLHEYYGGNFDESYKIIAEGYEKIFAEGYERGEEYVQRELGKMVQEKENVRQRIRAQSNRATQEDGVISNFKFGNKHENYKKELLFYINYMINKYHRIRDDSKTTLYMFRHVIKKRKHYTLKDYNKWKKMINEIIAVNLQSSFSLQLKLEKISMKIEEEYERKEILRSQLIG